MLIALTREMSPLIGNCELTHRPRSSIDIPTAQLQHQSYEKCLAELGCVVRRIPAAANCPDCVFIEDTCLVFDEFAVITRPGAASRRMETAGVADAIKDYRPLHLLQPPATLDGGDVLQLGRRVFVGISTRTNQAGFEQLRTLLVPEHYEVTPVPLNDCLHLKSAVTNIATNTILVNRIWVDPACFGEVEILDVDPAEPDAANALLIGESVVYSTMFPKTLKRLEGQGIRVAPIDTSELIKAEGGVTCCSIVFNVDQHENDSCNNRQPKSR